MKRYIISKEDYSLISDCILMNKKRAVYNRFILGKTLEEDHEIILDCIDFYIGTLVKYQSSASGIEEYISYVNSLKQMLLDKWHAEKYGIEKEEI